jgi:hypothetical protein
MIVCYMIHKEDVLSIQREMNLRWSKPMREVDGPNFIFIDFNVPALAPRLSWIQTALQLSENITPLRSVAYVQVSSAKKAR